MNKKTRNLLFIALCLSITVIIYACKHEEAVIVEPTATPTLPPEQKAIWESWEGSQHADTYALDKGPNTYCAKCHSPQNWDYRAKIDPPPNCVSCKFPFETEPRIAASNPLVPESEWANIGCDVCHQMNGQIADPQYYWHDNATGFYEVVSSTTELCEKCHTNSTGGLYHQRNLGSQVHQGYTCTDCHDPHDPYASCGTCHLEIITADSLPIQQHLNLSDKSQCLACHPNGMNTHSMETQRTGEKNCLVCHDYFANLTNDDSTPVYHSKVHNKLECVACHDASGLEVGMIEGTDNWTTFRTLLLPVGEVIEPYQSHNLSSKVDCSRCHFEDNPWNLPASVEVKKQ